MKDVAVEIAGWVLTGILVYALGIVPFLIYARWFR